jgi:hypothetical protein
MNPQIARGDRLSFLFPEFLVLGRPDGQYAPAHAAVRRLRFHEICLFFFR